MIQVAVVQFAPRFGRKADNLRRMAALTAGIQADLVVFPELCTTGYFFQSAAEAAAAAEPADGPAFEFFRALAERMNAVVVAGFAEQDAGAVYNACMLVRPGDRTPHVYRKTHLFYKETQCFRPGDSGFFVVPVPGKNFTVGPMVCYDWRFPEAARVLALLGAEIIACPANLVTDAWQVVMPARAVENKVYLAVANRTGRETRGGETLAFKGRSAVYDWRGHTLRRAGAAVETVLTAAVDPAAARDKSFNPVNDVLADRRPQFYTPLCAPAVRRD